MTERRPETLNIPGTSLAHDTFTTNGITLHCVTTGSGSPVLLWHGFLGTWYSWRKLIPLLASEHTVVVPDMRGYGDSDKPESGYDGLSLVADFRALVRYLNLGPLHVVAHDMGAPPALLWAAHHPSEVKSLVYLDEPVLTDASLAPVFQFSPETTKNGGLWWWLLALAGDAPERLIVGHERPFLTWFYENFSKDRSAIEEEAVSEFLRTFSGGAGVHGALGVYRAIFETVAQTEPLRSANVQVPVLALGGALSLGSRPHERMHTVAKQVSGGAIENCGHFIAEEKPAELYQRLIQFWSDAS